MSKYEIYDMNTKMFTVNDIQEALYYYLQLYNCKLLFIEQNNIILSKPPIINLYIIEYKLCGSTFIEIKKIMMIDHKINMKLSSFNKNIYDKIILKLEKEYNIAIKIKNDDKENNEENEENNKETIDDIRKKELFDKMVKLKEKIEKEKEKKLEDEKNKLLNIKIMKFKEEEALKEKKNIFDNDKNLYYRFKSLKCDIPELFTIKYKVFEEMDKDNLLNTDNDFLIYCEKLEIAEDFIEFVGNDNEKYSINIYDIGTSSYDPMS